MYEKFLPFRAQNIIARSLTQAVHDGKPQTVFGNTRSQDYAYCVVVERS